MPKGKAKPGNVAGRGVVGAARRLPGGKRHDNSNATVGGGLYVSNANVTLNICFIRNNTAKMGGGFGNSGSLLLNNPLIDDNIANGRGGGGYNLPSGTLIADRLIMDDNRSSG